MQLIFPFRHLISVEFRVDDKKNMSEKKISIVDSLQRYDVSIMRRNFGVSTSRVAIMNNYADALTALSTDFQHRDPCNLVSMKATLENVRTTAMCLEYQNIIVVLYR